VESGAEKPLIGPLTGKRRSRMGPHTLLATMTQSLMLPEQVFLMMMLPAAATSMPRSASVQLLPSMRLSEPVAWMPAPSPPVPLPLEEHVLAKTTHLMLTTMPLNLLPNAEHPVMVQPFEAEMPFPWLLEAVHPVIVLAKVAEMPFPPLKDAVHPMIVLPKAAEMPFPPLSEAEQPVIVQVLLAEMPLPVLS